MSGAYLWERFRGAGLRAQFLSIILLAMLPVFCLAGYQHLKDADLRSAILKETGHSIGEEIAGKIGAELKGGQNLLQAAVSLHESGALAASTTNMLLEAFPKRIGGIMAIGLEAAGGETHARIDSGTHRGKPFLTLRAPLSAIRPESTGPTMVARLDLAGWRDFFFSSLLPSDSVLLVVNREGTQLMRYPDNSTWIGRSFPDWVQSFSHNAATATMSVETTGYDGILRHNQVVPVPGSDGGLFLIIGLAKSVVEAETAVELWRAFGLLILTTLAGLGCSWWASECSVLKDVRDLAGISRRLSQGDVKARFGKAHGARELRLLGAVFDEMADRLQENQEHLEELVRARTGALERMNGVLRDSEETHRALIETTGTGFLICDVSGCVLDANSEYVRLSGHSAVSELVGRIWLEWVPPHFRCEAEAGMARCLKSGRLRNLEIAFTGPAGQTPVELNSTLVRLGQVDRVLTLARDITERKRAESALQKSEAKMRGLLEATPDPMIITDREGRIFLTNTQTSLVFGYSMEELLKLTVEDLMPERFRQKHLTVREKYLASESHPIHRKGKNRTGLRRDGTEFPIDVTHAIHGDGDGLSILCLIRDTTERQQVEERLRTLTETLEKKVRERTSQLEQARAAALSMMQDAELEKAKTERALHELAETTRTRTLLSRAIECSTATVIITNTEGDIEYVNPAFVHLTGYSEGEVLGRNPRLLNSGTHTTEFFHNLWMTVRSGKTWSGRLCNKRKNGDLFWEAATITPVAGADGELSHFVAVKEDITEMLATHAALEQAKAAAEAANVAKGQFLSNMSHEIRTPLNAVLGFSHLALKLEMPAQVREYLGKIRTAGTGVIRLINDILDLSKIEAGKVTIEEIEFDFEKIMNNLTTVVFEKAAEKNLDFFFRISSDVPRHLIGDPLRVSQVLVNLTANAVKFTEAGEIEVSTTVLERDEQRVKLLFSVRDTGIGISPSHRERLFKAFVQADGSTTRRYGGTGLGLDISKRLVELLGGEMTVESEEGRGSRFSFSAWFGINPNSIPSPRPWLEGTSILVVADRPASWTPIMPYFEQAAARVELVSTVEERDGAVFDLVFLDIPLCGERFQKVLDELRPLGPPCKTPAIVIVAIQEDAPLVGLAMKEGANGFLKRPFTPSNVMDAIYATLKLGSGRETDLPEPEGNWEGKLENVRILLVEDNSINQEIAVGILKQAGAVVEVAGNGRLAVERILTGEEHYDLVLMDVQMPEMDGIEATRLIRETRSSQNLPIIAMTALALSDERARCLEAGMNDHIVKPLDPTAFFDTLNRWIPGNGEGRDTTLSRLPEPATGLTRERTKGEAISLPAIEGLDVLAGAGRLGGNVSLYLRMVQRFAEDEVETVTEIGKGLLAGDYPLVEKLVHAIKGVTGNLSAGEAHSLAITLESAVKERQESTRIQQQYDLLFQAVRRLVANIRSACPENESGNPGESLVDDLAFGDGLVELAGFLRESNLEMIESFRKLGPSIRANCQGQEFYEMERAMKSGEFDHALDHLDRVASRMRISLEPGEKVSILERKDPA